MMKRLRPFRALTNKQIEQLGLSTKELVQYCEDAEEAIVFTLPLLEVIAEEINNYEELRAEAKQAALALQHYKADFLIIL